jgi:two-component system, cell cycle response regulator
LGGEEFLLVLPDTGVADAFDQAEQLRKLVRSHAWAELTGPLPITISIGVTTTLDGETTQAAMLQQADRNLYAAKRSGRNRVLADPV